MSSQCRFDIPKIILSLRSASIKPRTSLTRFGILPYRPSYKLTQTAMTLGLPRSVTANRHPKSPFREELLSQCKELRSRAEKRNETTLHERPNNHIVVLAFFLCFFYFFSKFWLIVGKLWEARSRLYRRQNLQVNTNYSFESSWRNLEDLHTFATWDSNLKIKKNASGKQRSTRLRRHTFCTFGTHR